jgi:hypothetical protein
MSLQAVQDRLRSKDMEETMESDQQPLTKQKITQTKQRLQPEIYSNFLVKDSSC